MRKIHLVVIIYISDLDLRTLGLGAETHRDILKRGKKITMFTPVPLLVPLMAPLSYPLLSHWAEQSDSPLSPPNARALKEGLEQDGLPSSQWVGIEQLVRTKSRYTFRLIDEVVQPTLPAQPKVKTGWLLDTLTQFMPARHSFQRDTLNKWASHGVVRQKGHGWVEPHSASELVTARQIVDPERKREWMDAGRLPSEPYFYVWCQVTPNAPAVPWPYPFPSETPPEAVIWTSWLGVSWDPLWVSIEGLGAIRFAGATMSRGKRHWLISKKQLRMWDPYLLPLDPGVLERTEEAFDAAATWTLACLAIDRLKSPLPPFASVAL